MFWSVLEDDFTDNDRSAFARFCFARSRLPNRAAEYRLPFIINFLPESNALPQAHTCFMTLDLPKYSDRSTMRDKLYYAIMNSGNIMTNQ
jgi:HECT-domain (ubiquitin-transferase)